MGEEFGSWFIISGFYMLKHVFLVSVCYHGLAFSSPFLVLFYVSLLLLLLLLGTMVVSFRRKRVRLATSFSSRCSRRVVISRYACARRVFAFMEAEVLLLWLCGYCC